MKFLKFTIRSLQAVVALAALAWLLRVGKASGSYLVDHFAADLFGKTTTGTIQEIHKNRALDMTGNYLARVSFTGPQGESLMREFRYAEPQLVGSSTVSIRYRSLQSAALMDDGGYFKGTMQVLLGIGGFFCLLFMALASLNWLLFKRVKT